MASDFSVGKEPQFPVENISAKPRDFEQNAINFFEKAYKTPARLTLNDVNNLHQAIKSSQCELTEDQINLLHDLSNDTAPTAQPKVQKALGQLYQDVSKSRKELMESATAKANALFQENQENVTPNPNVVIHHTSTAKILAAKNKPTSAGQAQAKALLGTKIKSYEHVMREKIAPSSPFVKQFLDDARAGKLDYDKVTDFAKKFDKGEVNPSSQEWDALGVALLKPENAFFRDIITPLYIASQKPPEDQHEKDTQVMEGVFERVEKHFESKQIGVPQIIQSDIDKLQKIISKPDRFLSRDQMAKLNELKADPDFTKQINQILSDYTKKQGF